MRIKLIILIDIIKQENRELKVKLINLGLLKLLIN